MMNKSITNNTLRIWLKDDLSGVVGTLDHWSQGGPTTDNIFMRSKQYYITNGDRRLPEPELPDKLMCTRQYLLAPGQPLPSKVIKPLSPLRVDPLSKLKGIGYSLYDDDNNNSDNNSSNSEAPKEREREKPSSGRSRRKKKRVDSAMEDFQKIQKSVVISNGLVEKGDQIFGLLPDSKPMVEKEDCDALWSAFSKYGYIILRGLINEKDIDEAHRHVQKFLLDNKLVDPVTMEIMEEPAVPQGSGSVKKFKSGFIASLDGQTFIKEKERFSNGETVDICDHHTIRKVRDHSSVTRVLALLCSGRNNQMARNGAGDELSNGVVHMLADSYGYLRVLGYKNCTPRHADIFDFKTKFKEFFSQIKHGEEENGKKKCCASCDRPIPSRIGAAKASYYKVCKECNLCYHTDCKLASKDQSESVCKGSSTAFKPAAKRAVTRRSSPRQVEVIDLTQDVDIEDEIRSEKETTAMTAARSECWWCDDCRLFQHDLTLGTCWIPLQDIGTECGPFAVLPGSSSLPDFYLTGRKTYDVPKSFDSKKANIHIVHPDVLEWGGASKAVDESTGVGSGSAHGFLWHTGPVQKGDVVIFDSHAIHGAGKNFSTQFKCSLDIRFVLAPPLHPSTSSRSNSRGLTQSSYCSSGSRSSSSSSSSSGLAPRLRKAFKESTLASFLNKNAYQTS